ncbi:ATP synthase beta subunit C-terminal domain-containing protein [Ruegeria haliotis]|uniref:ATP synthase beta subunit C-terminal domain-containing protein n=1 Tax=Ruegeria haliotis TaxID=2747601 RepID=UPI0038B675FC
MSDWYDRNAEPGWTAKVRDLLALIEKGEQIDQMMQVTGEEGVTIEDFVTQQKALFVDMVYLQQDAFDKVDATVPLERQKKTFKLIYDVTQSTAEFADKAEVRKVFTHLTDLVKNFHYAAENAPEYKSIWQQIENLCRDKFNL